MQKWQERKMGNVVVAGKRDGQYLCIPLRNGTILVTRNDVTGQSAEAGNSNLGQLIADNTQNVLAALLGLRVRVDVVDADGAELALTLLGHAEQLRAVLVELAALDGGSKLPSLEQLARLDLPQSHGVVGAAGGQKNGARVDIDGPESTLVALVDTEALTVV